MSIERVKEYFGGFGMAERIQEFRPAGGVVGQEDQPRAVMAFLRDGHTLKQDELVRNLDHDSGTVAGFPVRPFGAAVAHILQDGQGVGHKFVRLVAPDIHHHTYAAGIVFECRVI